MKIRNLLLAGIAALVTGCGLGGPGHGIAAPAVTPPVIRTLPSAAGSTVAALPLDSYEDLAGNPVFRQAELLLITSCMRARGFTYDSRNGPALAEGIPSSPYGITSLADARVHGYRNSGSSHLQESTRRAGSLHPPAYNLALTGAANAEPSTSAQVDGSCLAKASDEITSAGTATSADFQLVGNLETAAENYTESDSRVRAAERAWNQCMTARGFRKYATPQAASQANWPARPDPAEIATAVADVTCKQRVSLVGTWNAVEAGYQRELMAQHTATLATVARSVKAEVRKSEAVVAAGHA